MIDLPIVLPPSVAGLSLLIAFGRRGLLGSALSLLGISLPFTTTAVVLAQTFVAAPLYVRSAHIGFAEIDKQLEEAAQVEGANQWQLFYEVMFPLASRALLSGAILDLDACSRRIWRNHPVCRKFGGDHTDHAHGYLPRL